MNTFLNISFRILFLLLISTGLINAQRQREVDSLLQIIKGAKGTDLIDQKAALVRQYINLTEYDKANDLLGEIYKESKELNYVKGEGAFYHLTGLALQNQSKYAPALKNYLKGLELRKIAKDSVGIGAAYNNIGNVYMEQGQYELALKYHQIAFEIRTKIKQPKFIAMSYNNFGEIYRFQGQYNKAIENYLKAIVISQQLNDYYMIGLTYGNIALVYSQLKNYKDALQYQLKALNNNVTHGFKFSSITDYIVLGDIYKEMGEFEKAHENYQKSISLSFESNYKVNIGNSYRRLGMLAFSQKKYNEAIDYFDKALALLKTVNNQFEITATHINLGDLYFQQKNYNEALTNYSTALRIANEIHAYNDQITAHKGLAETYELIKDFSQAFTHFSRYASLKDSLMSQASIKQINELSAKYESDTKEKEIELLKKSESLQKLQITNQENQISRQRMIVFFSLLSIGLIAISLLLMYNRYHIKKKSNEQLAIAYEQIKEKNKLITNSINYSKRLQEAILMKESEIKKHLPETFIFFQPKDVVSGDFYWFSTIEQKKIIVVADCTGHGVPGALMSMIGNSILNQIINENKVVDPAKILHLLNENLLKTFTHYKQGNNIETEDGDGDGMDISICTIDTITNEVTFAGANQCAYISHNGNLSLIKGDGLSIGGIFGKHGATFTNKKIAFEPNSSLYLLSDGFTDQFGGMKNQKFMTARFESLLRDIDMLAINEQKAKIENTFYSWKGDNKQIDDVLVWGVKLS